MKDKAVITVPLSPTRNNQLARFVTPIVGETISKSINANYHLCVNMLDSFNNHELTFLDYKKSLNSHGIKPDELWIDKEHISELTDNIYKMIKSGYIYDTTTNIYRCDCGVLEIEKKNLNTLNPQKRGYDIVENKLVCKKCHGECKEYQEKVLVFDPYNIDSKDILLFPNFLTKDAKTFQKTILSSYNVISRNRNTGISINYNGTNYMIDIDFVWGMYLALFKEQEKIVICGNKELYQLYMLGVLEKCLNPNSTTLFVGTPMINGINDFDFPCQTPNDILTKKLGIIFNMTWGAKVKDFDSALLDKLKRMPYEKKLKLYEIVCNPIQKEGTFYYRTTTAIRDSFNYQQACKTLKRGKNSV